MTTIKRRVAEAGFIVAAVVCVAIGLSIDGSFGPASVFHRSLRWVNVDPAARRLPAEIKLALSKAPPPAVPGPFEWHQVTPGFEVGEMPVMANGHAVDTLLLTRIDPTRYRLIARNAPANSPSPRKWLRDLGAVFVINGSYFGPAGLPDTPFVSDGVPLGPMEYQAREGALTIKQGDVEIHDLAHQDWQAAVAGAQDALVSYPLLIGAEPGYAVRQSRWVAGRSFVAKDKAERVVFGTTMGGYFSLDRLAIFLRATSLDLTAALNLDGGLVACQAIALPGFHRDACSDWEIQESADGKVRLLQWPWGGHRSLPLVIAAVPRQ